MSRAVFFLPAALAHPLPSVGDVLGLSGPEGRHAVLVKRVEVGEEIIVSDGAGFAACCQVQHTSGKDQLSACITEVLPVVAPTPVVTMVQALPKAERAELAIDLMTQGGADRIIPWAASRCIAKWNGPKASKGQAKWQAAAYAAAKQSRRLVVPPIDAPVDLPQLLAEVDRVIASGGTVLALHEESASPIAAHIPADSPHIMVIVGPEGGIAPEEIDALRAHGAQPVLLGPEVLRTASAGFAALNVIGVTTSRWAARN